MNNIMMAVLTAMQAEKERNEERELEKAAEAEGSAT